MQLLRFCGINSNRLRKGFMIPSIVSTILSTILLTILITLSFGHVAHAADKVYFIEKYNILVGLNADGSADIEEQITYNFRGDMFNGVTRDVDFSSTGGMTDAMAYIMRGGKLVYLIPNKTSDINYNGMTGSYNYVVSGTLGKFKIFEASKNESKTFIYKYKFLNTVTRYRDIAEFNRKVIDTKWQTRLDNISIRITLPEGASKEELKVFAHGPLTGTSTIIDGRTFEFVVPSLSPGTFVETRALFPPRLVPGAGNVVDKDGLPGILEAEGKLADEANALRENAKREADRQERLNAIRKIAGYGVTGVSFLAWFFIIYLIYIRYDRERRPAFQGKYYRELPGDYTPAEMSRLVYFEKTYPRDLLATLMNLVRKKQLLLEVGKSAEKSLFGKKEVSSYRYRLNPQAPVIELKSHETFLIQWFLSKIGDGDSVELDDILDYAKQRQNAITFKKDYDQWCLLVSKDSASNGFFDPGSGKGIIISVLFGILYIAAGILTVVFLLVPWAVAVIIQGAVLIVFGARLSKRSQYGSDQYAMWMALKNFLKDFSNLERATIPSIIMWEHFLVYAISLDVAEDVIKQLPVVFRDDDLNNNNLTFLHYHSIGQFALMHHLFNDTIRTVEGAVASATQIANSQKSSGSGGGGGFSGGSSGGGGGGGGGGAF